MTSGEARRSGVVQAAAAVWLIIGLLVLVGVTVGVVAFAKSASSTSSADPTPFQSARPAREDAFWNAYQASPLIKTKMSRTNALALADQMCTQEGANPGGILAYAQSRHATTDSLAETTEMLRLAHGLCG